MGMGECGCIGPLIKMLDDKAAGEKEAVAKALSSSSLTVMLSAMIIKIFRRDRKGIVSLPFKFWELKMFFLLEKWLCKLIYGY